MGMYGKIPPANGRECGEQAARILLPKPSQNFSNPPTLSHSHSQTIPPAYAVSAAEIMTALTGLELFGLAEILPGRMVRRRIS